MISIRDLDPGDIPEAASLTVEPGTPWHRHGLNHSEVSAILESGLAEEAKILVATSGTQVVGYVWLERRGTFYHAGYIRMLAVRSDQRGKDIGTALMNSAEQEVFRSSTSIFLLVSEWNELARAFYKKRGYVEVGKLPDYVKTGSTEIICWKTIGVIHLVPGS